MDSPPRHQDTKVHQVFFETVFLGDPWCLGVLVVSLQRPLALRLLGLSGSFEARLGAGQGGAGPLAIDGGILEVLQELAGARLGRVSPVDVDIGRQLAPSARTIALLSEVSKKPACKAIQTLFPLVSRMQRSPTPSAVTIGRW